MEQAVQYLTAELLPELAILGETLARTKPGIATTTFSHRHALQLHSFGLSCFPAGSDQGDERCVSLIVNVIDIDRLSVRGFIKGGAPSFPTEAETAFFLHPTIDELAVFCGEVRGLFRTLATAAGKI